MALSRRAEQSDSDDGPVRRIKFSGTYGSETEVSYRVASVPKKVLVLPITASGERSNNGNQRSLYK